MKSEIVDGFTMEDVKNNKNNNGTMIRTKTTMIITEITTIMTKITKSNKNYNCNNNNNNKSNNNNNEMILGNRKARRELISDSLHQPRMQC